MFVYIVWNNRPKYGVGDYLLRIFRNKEKAEKYCEQMNKKVEKDYGEDNNIHYSVEKWSVY